MRGTLVLKTWRSAEKSCLDYMIYESDTGIQILVRDSKATLIDFDTARKCDDRNLLLQEFENLTVCPKDQSHRGGGGL